MRKVKLQMQVSVDGFVAGPGGELDWLQKDEDAAMLEYVAEITKDVDCILPDSLGWRNCQVTKEDFIREINRLKQQPGGSIIVYGGSCFVSSMIKEGLIDEFHFFINPTAIGNGLAIFKTLDHKMNLKLVTARSFDSGVVLLFYKPE